MWYRVSVEDGSDTGGGVQRMRRGGKLEEWYLRDLEGEQQKGKSKKEIFKASEAPSGAQCCSGSKQYRGGEARSTN